MTSIPGGIAAASVPEDDLEAELAPLRRRRRLAPLTAGLALAVVAAGAFVGGVEIQKSFGAGSTARGGGGGGGSGAAAARRGFSFGGGGGGSGLTAGRITLIKGTTLYVTDASGNTIRVTTGGAQVTKTVTSTVGLSALSPGDTVVVRGTKGKDGSYAASTITLGGAGAGLGARGFGGGFSRGAGSGGATGFGFPGGSGGKG